MQAHKSRSQYALRWALGGASLQRKHGKTSVTALACGAIRKRTAALIVPPALRHPPRFCASAKARRNPWGLATP